MAEKLKQQRANTKKSMTRIKNYIESARNEGNVLPHAELKCRLAILEAYFKQILTTQSSIEALDPEDNCRSDLEELYINAKMAIQSQLGDEFHNTSISDGNITIHQSTSKLPPLQLPSFNGKYSEFKNFITTFTQIIDRESTLSNLEKFNYLLTCLHGPSLETVNAFQVTNENYSKALNRLKDRYDNPTLIFMENVSALFDLPGTSKPEGDKLRSLIDTASTIYSSLLSLGSERDIAQAMLIHIVMQKCDEGTRRKWKESLDFKRLPCWNDCSAVLERHCQYLQSLDKTSPCVSDVHTNDKLSKIKKSHKDYAFSCTKSSCIFCSSANHKLNGCERFESLSTAQRFDTVKRFTLCINCLSKGHQRSNCPSTYSCKICSDQHHTL
ncbi:uncharacterized protein LOC119690240 [Teleopsis dalmanni]|uniref:uncharacterized protein LOC119690240 n=1 Tax=Teleopsis dalmanni TaxID=139649 RepID=UPI0018CF92D6|nr:uncharacterized protein LOC119690240 [Teleopsis dalmanni]